MEEERIIVIVILKNTGRNERETREGFHEAKAETSLKEG